MTVNTLTGEECTLTLDYAYYHILFCLLQAGVLWLAGRTENFHLAHAFGLFAFVMDYALNFLTTGTRTISYPYAGECLDDLSVNGMQSEEKLDPVGELMFFAWFDYAAFGLLLWALTAESFVRDGLNRGVLSTFRSILSNPIDMFNLFVVPIQFWTAPRFAGSEYLGVAFDPRTVVLTRSSSKLTYVALLAVGMLALRFLAKLSWKLDILPIVLSGFGCGLIHHAALFVFGMRGYTDLTSLVLTLCTEWPALITGVAVFRHLGWPCVASCVPFLTTPYKGRAANAGTVLFTRIMWLLLAALIYPHLANIDEKDAVASLMPLIPGQHMQSVGTLFLRTTTCGLPIVAKMPGDMNMLSKPLECFARSNDSTRSDTAASQDLLVMASAAKSGAVLSARIVAEIGISCGICIASGERSAAGIPGPVEELPVYEGQLLHAIINMRTWPQYARRFGYGIDTRAADAMKLSGTGYIPGYESVYESDKGRIAQRGVRCVVIMREPSARLRSLYTYARSGGEHWFRYETGMMARLSDSSITLNQSLAMFWNEFGKGYLIQSHEYMSYNLKLGCQPVTMEAFRANYTAAAEKIMVQYNIRREVIPLLLSRLAGADLSQKTVAEQRADKHVTSNKFSGDLLRKVGEYFRSDPEISSIMAAQRIELGY